MKKIKIRNSSYGRSFNESICFTIEQELERAIAEINK